ncbi:MAG: L-serine ammonia-lyase, iron-sulfur-dependent, subunit alpha [Peptococcaceae bacterium]|jgi:L-cysteine desulfidase|nr:L-serine ammonia-lyase, iron-sulfur-dependent, subunit alpha [Peptococcaceae bacterium]
MSVCYGDPKYEAYLRVLARELLPAMGCTEPVALAFAAAKIRALLGCVPERVAVAVSGNIIKNAKSVVVPNTGGMKGIPAAVAAGLIAGDGELGLEVISRISESQKAEIRRYLADGEITVTQAPPGPILDILITAGAGAAEAKLRISDQHTHIVYLERDGEILLDLPAGETGAGSGSESDDGLLNVDDIVAFADGARLEDLQPLIQRQIDYNTAVALEGLAGSYGAGIGRLLLRDSEGDPRARAKAMAAAASDARMSGCELPVIILSGSGNQGITASLPIAEYARARGVGTDRLIRAVALSDLIALHQKRYIGRLSAYCGVVCAGAAAGAGIAYLLGGGRREVAHALVNALAILSGMICDGAKPSCAAKIAMAVEAGIMGFQMYQCGAQFRGGDGIIKKGVENTIQGVGRLGRDGMRETDAEILRIMLDEPAVER